MQKIVNIAGYKFTNLADLATLKQQLYTLCSSLAIKGTILLSEEGINIMLAGADEAIKNFMAELSACTDLGNIEFKFSYSATIPFKRLKVKIKQEIITFAVPGIEPHKQTGRHLAAKEFNQWLEQQRDIVVLDVRNRCEVAAGTFSNATDLGIDNFRSFSRAIQQMPNSEQWKQKPVVTFCTGGIRCEKASAYLLQQGYQEVYQLEGGILQYFQECGDAYFTGKCFVFDERSYVDGSLRND